MIRYYPELKDPRLDWANDGVSIAPKPSCYATLALSSCTASPEATGSSTNKAGVLALAPAQMPAGDCRYCNVWWLGLPSNQCTRVQTRAC